jgi:hypothetical protein
MASTKTIQVQKGHVAEDFPKVHNICERLPSSHDGWVLDPSAARPTGGLQLPALNQTVGNSHFLHIKLR